MRGGIRADLRFRSSESGRDAWVYYEAGRSTGPASHRSVEHFSAAGQVRYIRRYSKGRRGSGRVRSTLSQSLLFRVFPFLRLLGDLLGDILVRRRCLSGKGSLHDRAAGGTRGRGQPVCALTGLKIAQTFVDHLAHVVLHILQISQSNRDRVGFLTLLSAFARQHDQIG